MAPQSMLYPAQTWPPGPAPHTRENSAHVHHTFRTTIQSVQTFLHAPGRPPFFLYIHRQAQWERDSYAYVDLRVIDNVGNGVALGLWRALRPSPHHRRRRPLAALPRPIRSRQARLPRRPGLRRQRRHRHVLRQGRPLPPLQKPPTAAKLGGSSSPTRIPRVFWDAIQIRSMIETIGSTRPETCVAF